MYKLVLYHLIVIIIAAIIFSLFGILPYNPVAILFSVLFITTVCLITNIIFAWAFKAPTNAESVYITALILALIITPIATPGDMQFFMIATWASILAMASKYILAIKNKHIFNPVAISVAIIALTTTQSASWWVGTASLSFFVIIGGLLIARKIQRFDLVISFFVIAFIVSLNLHISGVSSFITNFWRFLVNTSLSFFAFIMLTEPLTTPPTRFLRILYGAFVGLLFSPSLHIGGTYFTPELALVCGNIFSYIVSPKQKLLLKLKERIHLSSDTYDFVFSSNQKLKFEPGQYLEWTLDKEPVDSRGNRRYFTISSSSTEPNIAIGIKFYPESSSFKGNLLKMKRGDTLVASQLAGDFTLPKNKNKKIVFIAGGIGITPFRSIIKNLIDTKQKRDIVLLYSNKSASDIVYKKIFDEASMKLGIKTKYIITDSKEAEYTGRLNEQMIKSDVPDYLNRYFYISGPLGIVTASENTLLNLGVQKSHIKTDFFPGFA